MQKHHNERKFSLQFSYLFLSITTVSFLLNSCTTNKNLSYFNNLPNDTLLHNLAIKDFEIKIRKGDFINIMVTSLSAEESALFNSPQAGTGAIGTAAAVGFMVDKDGNISYPRLGAIHAEGLTRDELKNILIKQLAPFLKEPVVTVNFVNHKVVVMGEVVSPQVVTLPAENLTLLQALALCGGINKTGRKDNVLVIRENGSDKQFKRLNLTASDVFASPYYYLRPDDIVYVENDHKKGNGNLQQIIAITSTGLSLLFLILSRIK